MHISINIFGIKLTNEDFSRIGLNQVMLSLHHYYFINIAKELTICMESGTAVKGNLLSFFKQDSKKYIKKSILLFSTVYFV